MELIPDAPDIKACMFTGYSDWNRKTIPICPVCGEECDTLYRDNFGNVVGCDNCVTNSDAWEENL